jgi:PAS domain S-box-containing protein
MHALIHHTHPDGRPYPKGQCHIRQSTLEGRSTHVDNEVHWRADGSRFPVEYWSHPMYQDGKLAGAVVTFVDISERKQAEEHLALVNFALDHVNEAAYMMDEQGRFRYVNEEACRALEYRRDELLALRGPDLDPDTNPQEWQAHWDQIRARNSFTFERRHRTRSGHTFPVEVNANYFEYHGHPYVVALVRDIGARRQAEQALRANEVRARATFEQAAVGIAEVAPDGRWMRVNQRLCDIVGYSREELLSTTFQDITHPDDIAADLAHVQRLVASKVRTFSMEKRYVRKDGGSVWTNLTVSLVRQEDGALDYFIGVIEDISARKSAEMRAQRLSRLYHTQSEASQGIIRATSEANLFDMICRVAVEFGGFRLAFIAAAAEASAAVRVLASHGPGKGFLEGLDLPTDSGDSGHRSPTAFALLQGHPHFCNDFQNAPETSAWHARGRRYGFVASATLPLHCRGKVVAALHIFCGDSEVFDTETQKLVLEMAANLSYALDRLADRRDLVSERDRAQGYLDVAGVMIMALDAQGRVARINRRGLDILGYASEQEVLGRDWIGNFLPPACRPSVGELARRILQGDIEEYYENPIVNRAGEERLIAWHNAALRNGDGDIVGVLTSGEDITERRRIGAELERHREHLEDLVGERTIALEAQVAERKRAEEEVQRLNASLRRHAEELEISNRELESFSYTVSHDLRAPLRSINGFTSLLREAMQDYLVPESRNLLERVIANTQKMGQLIDDILEYSRIGRASMKRVTTDLKRLAEEVVEELAVAYPATEVVLTPMPIVKADATMMRQVLANLIGNALKFSAGVASPQVWIGTREVDGAQEFFVRDNGAGFDMRYAGKLFGMFQRMHGQTEFAGSGVGLAIVKRLVERHGGRIRAEAAPGQGAMFAFTLDGRDNNS